MIITDTIAARANMDLMYAEDQNAINAALNQLNKAIIHEGEGVGAFIRPDSMWWSKREGEFNTFVLEAFWCPDPEAGVEFRGGAIDGECMGLPRSSDGRPPEHWVVADPGAALHAFRRDELHPSPSRSTGYRRAGIDSQRDVWVYVADTP